MHVPALCNRSIKRIAAFIFILFTIWILSNAFETRKTAWSCRRLSSCLGLTGRQRYAYARPELTALSAGEHVLPDGTTVYHRKTDGNYPEILFLVLNRDANDWSSDFRQQPRSAHDMMALIATTDLDLRNVSLAVSTTSKEEYTAIISASNRHPVSRVIVFLDPATQPKDKESYKLRHDPALQLQRRSTIAKARNRLMFRGLTTENHVFWLDADVVEISKGTVQAMLSHSAEDRDAGIITARCAQNQMDNYDKNAWKINDASLLGPVVDGGRDAAAAKLVETRLFVPELIDGRKDGELVALDSVGGTLLYLRAELVRQGLMFPVSNVVGTTWARAGWVGVETEGLCYVARGFEGGGCYVLTGEYWSRHSDWG